MIIQKQYARRNIEGYLSPYAEELQYKSITELSREEIESALASAMQDSKARDISGDKGWSELEDFKDFAGNAYHPETWVVAYSGEAPIGVIFAQRYHDKLEEGSIFFIGVLPSSRGKGLSKILHAKGLEMLASLGVKEYVGSTDIQNEPMIRTFATNGCRLYAIRDVEIGEGLV